MNPEIIERRKDIRATNLIAYFMLAAAGTMHASAFPAGITPPRISVAFVTMAVAVSYAVSRFNNMAYTKPEWMKKAVAFGLIGAATYGGSYVTYDQLVLAPKRKDNGGEVRQTRFGEIKETGQKSIQTVLLHQDRSAAPHKDRVFVTPLTHPDFLTRAARVRT